MCSAPIEFSWKSSCWMLWSGSNLFWFSWSCLCFFTASTHRYELLVNALKCDKMYSLRLPYTVFWHDILERVHKTSQFLQDPKLDLNTAVMSLTSLREFIEEKWQSIEGFETRQIMYTLEKLPSRSRNFSGLKISFRHWIYLSNL